MHKSINLKIEVHVEGEDEPAHDFAQAATQALQDIIAAGRWRHPTLKVSINSISEKSGSDDDDSAGAAK
jgi:hypothetical protein